MCTTGLTPRFSAADSDQGSFKEKCKKTATVFTLTGGISMQRLDWLFLVIQKDTALPFMKEQAKKRV